MAKSVEHLMVDVGVCIKDSTFDEFVDRQSGLFVLCPNDIGRVWLAEKVQKLSKWDEVEIRPVNRRDMPRQVKISIWFPIQ